MDRRIFKANILNLILLSIILTISFLEILDTSLVFKRNEEQPFFGITSEPFSSDGLNYQGSGGRISYPNVKDHQLILDRFALSDQNELKIINQEVTSSNLIEINFVRNKMISSAFIAHDPISIDGNGDFNVFPGAGTGKDRESYCAGDNLLRFAHTDSYHWPGIGARYYHSCTR